MLEIKTREVLISLSSLFIHTADIKIPLDGEGVESDKAHKS